MRVFNATDEEDLHRSALFIVRERDEEGWYSELDDFEPPVPPEVAEADIDDLPEMLRSAARGAWTVYRCQVREGLGNGHQSVLLGEAREDGSGASAWRLLEMRGDYEYEGVYLYDVESGYM
jgi:hypothetical protein